MYKRTTDMARLENEIVKFIAEIELDPQKAAEATQNLEAVEKRCESLRQSISQNIRKMDELRAKNQTPRNTSTSRKR